MVTDNVIGPIPTVLPLLFSRVTTILADTPTMTLPKLRLVGVTLMGADTVSVKLWIVGEPTPFDAINQKVNTPLTVGVPLSVDSGTGPNPKSRDTKRRVFSIAVCGWNRGFWHTRFGRGQSRIWSMFWMSPGHLRFAASAASWRTISEQLGVGIGTLYKAVQ